MVYEISGNIIVNIRKWKRTRDWDLKFKIINCGFNELIKKLKSKCKKSEKKGLRSKLGRV